MRPDFLELERRTQKNLIDFLNIDLEIAFTMCAMAKATHDREHKMQLIGNIQTALKTIRHFERRLTDSDVRGAIHNKADRLEKLFSAL